MISFDTRHPDWRWWRLQLSSSKCERPKSVNFSSFPTSIPPTTSSRATATLWSSLQPKLMSCVRYSSIVAVLTRSDASFRPLAELQSLLSKVSLYCLLRTKSPVPLLALFGRGARIVQILLDRQPAQVHEGRKGPFQLDEIAALKRGVHDRGCFLRLRKSPVQALGSRVRAHYWIHATSKTNCSTTWDEEQARVDAPTNALV